jgi:exodeoxyribonuclease-5
VTVAAIEWTPAQLAAIERVRAWLASPETGTQESNVFRLFGHAGSGKSSVARTLAEGIAGQVRFAAFTGKAALVMQQKGCLGATTIHRLIYLPRIKCQKHLQDLAERLRAEPDADRRRELQVEHDAEKENLSRPAFTLNTASPLRDASLLVIDECSMCPAPMGADLLSFGVPILAIGDPAQLPPVRDRGYFTDPRQTPDLLLSEIHRQAAGSPVLMLATRVRQGLPLEYGRYGDSAVIRRREMTIADAAAGHDQIICGRNATRRSINARIREHHGLKGPFPVPGDRLVCRRNDYETGLLNGSLWTVDASEELDAERCLLSVQDEQTSMTVEAHRAPFEGREIPFYERREAQVFEYGFAITAHLSQGSQWRSVCVVDESDAFGADANRWLYTATTRASERVTVVR